MASTRSGAPLLPAISQSPLLSGDLGIPSDLFATLAGPLPTITIGSSPLATFDNEGGLVSASSSRAHRHFKFDRKFDRSRSNSSSPRLSPASIPPKDISSLLDLLESMDNDVASEVRRVQRGIQEARMLVQACREDSAARDRARRQKLSPHGM